MPLENKFFRMGYFSKTKCKSTKTITEGCFSCQNKSVRQKLAQSCRKSKSAQKAIYALFAQKPSIIRHLNASASITLLEQRPEKKFRLRAGFEPTTSAMPVQCSPNWAMKAKIYFTHQLSPGSIIIPHRKSGSCVL